VAVDWPALAWAAALFVVTLGVYLRTRSISLDDWDSINFAKAIDRFDLQLQQPHPPGYPAYVLLSRLVNLAAHDPLTSLTVLSAICGAGCVLAFYLLAADLGIGWAALPLAAMPLFWLNSEMAMSDVPGLFFAVASIWLLNRAAMADSTRARRWTFGVGCAVAGVAVGVRPQNVILPLFVLLGWVLPLLVFRARASWRDLAPGALAGLAACLAWAVPLLHSVDGDVKQLWAPVQKTLRYVKQADSLLGEPITRQAVHDRMADFGSVFSTYFGGPHEGGFAAYVGLCLALAVLAVAGRRQRATWLALAWLLPVMAAILLVMQPGDPRKVLPAVPPMLLLLGAAVDSLPLERPRRLGLAIGALLTVVFAVKAAPLVRILDTEATPEHQAVVYIAQHFGPDDALILAGTSLNHLYYELPEYTSLPVDYIDEDDLARELAAKPYRYIINLDEWEPSLDLPDEFTRLESWDFERDNRVLPKGSVVPFNLYERPPA
jgi:hypothetical protein